MSLSVFLGKVIGLVLIVLRPSLNGRDIQQTEIVHEILMDLMQKVGVFADGEITRALRFLANHEPGRFDENRAGEKSIGQHFMERVQFQRLTLRGEVQLPCPYVHAKIEAILRKRPDPRRGNFDAVWTPAPAQLFEKRFNFAAAIKIDKVFV
jgi:hypothetical protein